MRTPRPLLRRGLTAAAVVALPFGLAAAPAAAGPGISVSTSGSTVSVTTVACARLNGSYGNASLLTSSQVNFAQGRQTALAGSGAAQNAAWSNVSPGTYTVVVICSNETVAGTQAVVVSAASASATPTVSATSSSASPARGVMGGLGGATRDYGRVTLLAGAALVGSGVIASGWYLRRRARPHRF
ncbi:hypothetical protein [Streptomyces sp. NPDC008150]|uniref:hypothetical protein n=1 Tax=Streptomyces sp. NPDC008150 TaxID=3364816 RepID=UPI0036F0CC1C